MKQKLPSHKETKLGLIHFLSEPKVRVTHWSMEKDILSTRSRNWDIKELTGNGTLIIQFYQKPKHDNTTTKTKTGTAKGTKTTDRKIPGVPKEERNG